MKMFRLFVGLITCCTLVGCGATVPEIAEVWDGQDGTRQLEFEIKKRIFCDLSEAVRYVNDAYSVDTRQSAKDKVRRVQFIPNEWGAQVSLSFQVDESTALNPGIAQNTVYPNAITNFPGQGSVTTPQSFSLGLGGTASSTATRIDKFNPYYSIAFLMTEPTRESVCYPDKDPFVQRGQRPASSSIFVVSSDLRIKEWLDGAMWVNRLIPSSIDAPLSGTVKPDTVSLEIKFVVVSSGNVTPTWKLVRFSANTGNSPMFAANRTRTHDLIITIGPNNTNTLNAHLASQIGQAVSGANAANPPR
jgi:hypothetical protein